MIMLGDLVLTEIDELRDDSRPLKLPIFVQVRNVPDDQIIIVVERESIALLDQSPNIIVMIDQFVKH